MTDTFSSPWAFQKPYEYYSGFEKRPHLRNKFRDIDDEANFGAYLQLLENAQTQNFVLDFGNEDAWCAVNLEGDDIASLIRSSVSVDYVDGARALIMIAC